MSAAQRTKRAALYAYSDSGSNGLAVPTYTKTPSSATDGCWWASRAVPSGRDVAIAAQAERVVDAVLGFAAEAPVTATGLVQIDGQLYRITALLPRVNGTAEWQCHAVRADQAQYTLVGG